MTASVAYGMDMSKNGFKRNASSILPFNNVCMNLWIPQEGQYVSVSNHQGHLGIHVELSGGML